MKTIVTLLFLLLPTVVLHGAEAPELEKLRAAYRDRIEKATGPLAQTYLRELEKLREVEARAARLDAATTVQAEIDRITAVQRPTNTPGSAETNVPEMTRLNKTYEAAVAKATTPFTQVYLKELERLRDTYTRATNLEAAKKVQVELDLMKTNPAAKDLESASDAPTAVTSPKPQWIENQEWITSTGTHFAFGKNGKGEKSHPSAETTPFTWSILNSGLVEIWVKDTMKSAPRAWYIHFKNRSEADYGISPTRLDLQMRSR